MPETRRLDEDAAEAMVRFASSGPGAEDLRADARPDVRVVAEDPLARFLQDLRATAIGSTPTASAALVGVLQSGFSPDHLDSLVTATSHPAGRRAAASRRPKEKHNPNMTKSRLCNHLAAKIVAAGTTLLVGVSTAAAAGALPSPLQHNVAAVVQAVTPVQLPEASGSATTDAALNTTLAHAAAGHLKATTSVSGTTGMNGGNKGAGVNSSATVDASAGVGAAGVNAGASVGTSVGAKIPSPSASVSTVTATVTAATSAATDCLDGVMDRATGEPLTAIGTLLPTLVTCIQEAFGSLPIPPAVSSCVTGLLNSLASLPILGAGTGIVSLQGCIPINLSACLQAALGSITGLFGNPSIAGIAVVPNGIVACASSLVSAIVNLVNTLLGQVTATLPPPVSAGVSGAAGVHGRVKP